MEEYGKLELIWFDTPQLSTREQAIPLKQMVKKKQPRCLVNNRIGYDLGDYYQMNDNAIPTLVYYWKAWEIPATLNDTWGYKKMDRNWKDPGDLIYKLTDIVRKGGNRVTFTLPEAPIDPYNTVIRVGIEGRLPEITPGMAYNDPQDRMEIDARDARIRGEKARYDWSSQSVSGLKVRKTPSLSLSLSACGSAGYIDRSRD